MSISATPTLDFSFEDSRAACQETSDCVLMKIGACDKVQAIHLSQVAVAQDYSDQSKKKYADVECAPGWPIEYYEPLCLNQKCRAVQKNYRMLLEVPEQPVAGQPFWIGMSFRVPIAVEQVNAHFNLPDSVKVVSGQAFWSGPVEASRDYVLWAEVLANIPGKIYLTSWMEAKDNMTFAPLSWSEHIEVAPLHSLTPWPERERILATPTPIR